MPDTQTFHLHELDRENAEREIQMVGDLVGIAWQLKRTEKALPFEDATSGRGEVLERDGAPEIRLVMVEEVAGKHIELDGNPFAEPLTVDEAKSLIEELTEAVKLIESYK